MTSFHFGQSQPDGVTPQNRDVIEHINLNPIPHNYQHKNVKYHNFATDCAKVAIDPSLKAECINVYFETYKVTEA
jgi:hypothetical protein